MTTPNSPSSGTTASSGNGDATLKDSAQQLGQQARDKGREQVEAAREGTASHLDTLADSARAAADEMRDNDVANLSQYLTRMADGMSDFASRVRNKSGEEVFSEVRRLAQENPGLFVMGGLAVGFGLARFAKASASEAQDAGSDRSQWRTGTSSGASTGATGGYGGSGFSGGADRPGADVVASAGGLHSSGSGSTGSLGGMSGSTGSLGGGLSGSGGPGTGSTGLGSSASTAGTGSPGGGTLGGGATAAASGSPGERRDGLNTGTSDVGTGNNGLNHPAGQTGAQSLGGHSATGPGTGTSNPNRGGQTR